MLECSFGIRGWSEEPFGGFFLCWQTVLLTVVPTYQCNKEMAGKCREVVDTRKRRARPRDVANGNV